MALVAEHRPVGAARIDLQVLLPEHALGSSRRRTEFVANRLLVAFFSMDTFTANEGLSLVRDRIRFRRRGNWISRLSLPTFTPATRTAEPEARPPGLSKST